MVRGGIADRLGLIAADDALGGAFAERSSPLRLSLAELKVRGRLLRDEASKIQRMPTDVV